MRYQYVDNETLSQLLAPSQTVCALCDAGFALRNRSPVVNVEQIDGKVPETPTYVSLSRKTFMQIEEVSRNCD